MNINKEKLINKDLVEHGLMTNASHSSILKASKTIDNQVSLSLHLTQPQLYLFVWTTAMPEQSVAAWRLLRVQFQHWQEQWLQDWCACLQPFCVSLWGFNYSRVPRKLTKKDSKINVNISPHTKRASKEYCHSTIRRVYETGRRNGFVILWRFCTCKQIYLLLIM